MDEIKQVKKDTNIDINNQTPEYIKEIARKTLLVEIESPRACIMIVAAYMEDLITRILKKSLVIPLDVNDELFCEYGPVYNFGAKLNLAYRMGLISQDLLWALNKIRKLRDKCAHTHSEISFNDDTIKDLVFEIHGRLTKIHKGDTSLEKFQSIAQGILITLWDKFTSIESTAFKAIKEPLFN